VASEAVELQPRFVPEPVALGFWLAVPLVGAKIVHWSWPGTRWGDWPDWFRDVGVSAHADVAFAAAFGLLAFVLLRLARRWPRLERGLGAGLLALSTFCVFYAVASVQMFAFLRSPLTYPLLYLAGDVKSMRSSIGSFLSPAFVSVLVLVPLLHILAVRLTSGPYRGAPGRSRRVLRAVGMAAVSVWIAWGARTADGRWSDRPDLLIAESPHWKFVSSLIDEVRSGEMPLMSDRFPPGLLSDFSPQEPVSARTGKPRKHADAGSSLPRNPRPRNVLLVVLESTGTRYLSLYGSPYPTTPNLVAEAGHALVYDSFYAHVGLTANSLAALGLSVYPYMTWREYSQEYPDFPGDTLANVLGPLGYRTAFLTSSFLDYVGLDAFLQNRGFDEVRDWPDLSKESSISSWGGDEAVLVDRTLEWIDRDRERPFFGLLWTQQSHHPYDPAPGQPIVDFFAGGPVPPDDWDLGRHLNTLAEVDRQLGRLFAGLRERGLADDTLVVVTGDHGECFGAPHRTWGHGFRLYQEGINVPMMLWNPRLFEGGGRPATIAGHVDVNPTVLDILGVPAPSSWEGRSVFAPGRPPRAYFYAANDDYLLGVREGSFKYVYNATRGREELYDLVEDPEEQTNVAALHPEKCRVLRQRLAAWKHHAAGTLEVARDKMGR
jgi:arylsulfatase A-like enzyme